MRRALGREHARRAFGTANGVPEVAQLAERLAALGVDGDVVARHNGGNNVAFADGHAKWYKNENIKGKEAGGGIRFNGHELYTIP